MDDQLGLRAAQLMVEFGSSGASAADLMCDRHLPESLAFRFLDRNLVETRVTFGDLAERSRRVASVLTDHGVGAGDRVATLMGKHVDLPAVVLGIWRLGAVYVPLFTAFAAATVSDRLGQAAVAVVVTDTDELDKVPEHVVRLVAGVGAGQEAPPGCVDLAVAMHDAKPWDGVSPTGPAVELTHMFTSGTTGTPKAVVHPLTYAAGWQSYLETGLGVHGAAGVYWNAADPGWAYGLYAGIVAPMCAGVPSVICAGRFDPELTWRVLDEFAVTDFAAAPTVYRALRACAVHVPLPALRRLSSAGEPLTPDVFGWAERALGLQIHDHFGQTELGMPAGFAHDAAAATPVEPAAMGRALPGWSLTAVGMHDDDPVPPGQVGRLAVRVASSPFFTFTGYGTARDLPADRFSADGRYYFSGDLVSIDAAGLIHFSSRDDDVILMAGYRIGPFDVESVLARHPAVQESAVVAAPDDVRGEVIQAFVVTVPDAVVGEHLAEELQDWVKREYAAHAYPRRIEFVDALPKTPSGKVQRSVLRSRLPTGGSGP